MSAPSVVQSACDMGSEGWSSWKRLSLALSLIAVSSVPLFAVHDLGLFELDGNAVADNGGDDWEDIFENNDSALVRVFIDREEEEDGKDTSYFTGGGSKDVNDVSQWRHSANDVAPDKDEITNAYAGAYKDAEENVIFYFGADRFSNDGDAQIGFWFFQERIEPLPDGTFSGRHREGDILILSDFTQGGKISTIKVYEWVEDGRRASLVLRGEGCDCLARADECPNGNGDAMCAMVNDGDEDSPWPYQPKSGDFKVFPSGSFYEGGLIPARLGLEVRCFSSFLAETRSSQSVTAQLKDFALGDFELCRIEVDKDGDDLSKVGDPLAYDFTITNTGALTLYLESVVDVGEGWPGLGDLFDEATDAGCGSLAADESCQFSVDYTVQETDPDPLKNTVTVVYNSKPDLTGDQASDEDTHEVELFQPDVRVEKSGDELSKVGDPVNYLIRVTNTSSADSPPLVSGRITDDVLGDLLAAGNPYVTSSSCSTTLEVGESCEIRARRVVEAGDPDPLVNTVTVEYNPEGFRNEIGHSATHSVELFQPGLSLEKTGDALSKAGDPVNYVFTISNTSSADSPPLIEGQVIDSLLGNLLDPGNPHVLVVTCPALLQPGGSCEIRASRVVQPGDPDPLVNTVTARYRVQGFPNEITDSDTHTVGLFQPSVNVEKSGDELSKVGDPVNYLITVTNTSSVDSPPLVNGRITDTVLGNLLDPNNPYVTSTTCSSTLGVGQSCQIRARRTVEPGDPDPLVNTVTVHYNPQDFPNDITDSATHQVQIFQPSVRVEKSGDELSKAGDPVDYLIRVTNTSSADSPPLVNGRITDTLLGDLLDPNNPYVVGNTCSPTLAVGETCEIRARRTVEPDDPDPLRNTVTVHYNPQGFPNNIDHSDTHSVDLVHPDYELTKECAPTAASPGMTITYTIVLRNAGDVRLNLVSCDDSLIGPVDCPPSLEVGATETVVVTRQARPSDPDLLENTITTVYQVDGLPNQLTREASCTVSLLACRMTGGGNSEQGNGGNSWTFGGQAGSPTASQPQPCGEWTHHQQDGPAGDFLFHAGTASAPPGTEIRVIECSDRGFCQPARRAPAKQIDFAGVGTFKNIRHRPPSLRDVRPRRTFHWFEVHAEDLGEPGSDGQQDPPSPECPAEGNAGADADCICPDFYRIQIHETGDPSSAVIYEASGYLQGGNLQIHPPVLSGGNCGRRGHFIRGDVNSDSAVDLTDAILVLDHLLLGGQTPGCADAADADDNGDLQVTDAIVILETLFGGHGDIAWPFPESGEDPTEDSLEACPE